MVSEGPGVLSDIKEVSLSIDRLDGIEEERQDSIIFFKQDAPEALDTMSVVWDYKLPYPFPPLPMVSSHQENLGR